MYCRAFRRLLPLLVDPGGLAARYGLASQQPGHYCTQGMKVFIRPAPALTAVLTQALDLLPVSRAGMGLKHGQLGDVALKDGEGTVRTGKSRSLDLGMFPDATRRLAVTPTGAYRDEDFPFDMHMVMHGATIERRSSLSTCTWSCTEPPVTTSTGVSERSRVLLLQYARGHAGRRRCRHQPVSTSRVALS